MMPVEKESSEEALRKIVPVKSIPEQLSNIANVEPHIEIIKSLENKQSRNNDQELFLLDLKLYVANELEYAKGQLSEGQRPDAAQYIATLLNEFGMNKDVQEMKGDRPVLTSEQMEKELLEYYVQEYQLGMRTSGEGGEKLRNYAEKELQVYLKATGMESLVDLGKRAGILDSNQMEVLAYCDPKPEFAKPAPATEIAMLEEKKPEGGAHTMDFTKEEAEKEEGALAMPEKAPREEEGGVAFALRGEGVPVDRLAKLVDDLVDERRGSMPLEEFQKIRESAELLKNTYKKYSDLKQEIGSAEPTTEQLKQLDNHMQVIEDTQKKIIESMGAEGAKNVLDVIGYLAPEHRMVQQELSRRKVA